MSEAQEIVRRMSMEAWKDRVRRLKVETYALYLAHRDPRVPWYAKFLALCVVGYACSPIDLIPDFIPVLGYLDDLLLIPSGVILVRKIIPQEVLAECREKAQTVMREVQPTNWVAAGIIITIWVLLATLTIFLTVRAING